jgi:hypothetical protein
MVISRKNSIKVHYLLALSILFIFFISFSSASCQEKWGCFEWQKCIDNITARQCSDLNACQIYNNIIESQACSSIFPDCYNNVQDNDETDIDCGGKGCMPCSDENFCLINDDCLSSYCQSNKCSIHQTESPATKIISPTYAYFIFLLLFISLFLIIFIISQINKEFDYYQKNKFSIDLSSYLKKGSGKRQNELDEEIYLDVRVPEKEEKKIEKEIKKTEEKKSKESRKWLETDSIKVSLPQRRKEEMPESPSESKKKQILKDIKAIYEYSYE